MTVEEIVKEIGKLPSFLYEFYDDKGVHRVILGGQSCQKRDEHINLNVCERYFVEMQKLYEKDDLTDDEKVTIAKDMKRIMRQCDYRHSQLYSIKEQEEYLSMLDKEALEEIGTQVQMYKTAREYYRDYVHNK